MQNEAKRSTCASLALMTHGLFIRERIPLKEVAFRLEILTFGIVSVKVAMTGISPYVVL